MTNKIDTISEASIKKLVDTFYIKVRNDVELKPLFEGTIGTTDEAWQPHLEKMYAFWSSLMLSSGKYHGTPMQKHLGLPVFDTNLFGHWLELFEQAAHEIHTQDIAEQYYEKSRRVAQSLKLALDFEPRKQLP